MKVNRYKLKSDITIEDISNLKDGGTWIHPTCKKCVSKFFTHSFKDKKSRHTFEYTIDIGFPEDLTLWNDYDYIILLDEDFMQPYTPFYGHYEKGVKDGSFPVLEDVISQYNRYLDSLEFLEKII